MSTRSFQVNLLTMAPRPSWTLFKQWRSGTLWLFDDRAEFRPKSGDPLTIKPVLKAARGWKNSANGAWTPPIADTWVEVQFGDRANPQGVYVNDRRWIGWASLLLRNRQLVSALTQLAQPGDNDGS